MLLWADVLMVLASAAPWEIEELERPSEARERERFNRLMTAGRLMGSLEESLVDCDTLGSDTD